MQEAPRLSPFGLVLHHDGKWSHEGQPILNKRLREKFDRSVVYLASQGKFVVQVGQFKGEIEVEEAAFFVRVLDLPKGELKISDGTTERLDVSTLHWSRIDGALLCKIGRPESTGPVLARFDHSPHSELLLSIENKDGPLALRVRGAQIVLTQLEKS